MKLTLFNAIISFALSYITGLIGIPELAYLYTLAVFVPSVAVSVRRMHDVGKSGWFILIPIYNLILALQAGNFEQNKYGDNTYSAERRREQEFFTKAFKSR